METKAMSEIYNLIILDESGSMDCVTRQTIAGCNETINTIKSAERKYEGSQKHFVSIYAFQSEGSRPSRYIIKNEPAEKVNHITDKDYEPWGCTPLNDAVGATLVDLKMKVKSSPNAIGSVTIITDGAENSSEHYSTMQVAQMIEQLKEMGWSFNFIGANIDVKETAAMYNIDNALEFQQDEEGTQAMFERERKSRMSYYSRVEEVNMCCCADMAIPSEARAKMMKKAASNYFKQREGRIAPAKISKLKANEIFVFGSNLQGMHGGGAARAAVDRFGAIMGQGVGLQGQSYAIPTMQGGVETIKPYIDEFIEFATENPRYKFLVTRIGCGIAGFRDEEIAPLFREALEVENIYLPKSFIEILK